MAKAPVTPMAAALKGKMDPIMGSRPPATLGPNNPTPNLPPGTPPPKVSPNPNPVIGEIGVLTPKQKKQQKQKIKEDAQKFKEERKIKKYLRSDEGYLQDRADIKNQYDRFIAELGSTKSRYNQDYTDSLRNLGYSGGKFNEMDRLGAYGQALQQQGGDFANRGIRDSSFYLDALGDTQGSFNRQLGDMESDKQRTQEDWIRQQEQAKTDRTQALNRARMEALLRMAAEQGLVGV